MEKSVYFFFYQALSMLFFLCNIGFSWLTRRSSAGRSHALVQELNTS